MINVLHVDDAYGRDATAFAALRHSLSQWKIKLHPEERFSSAALDRYLNSPSSARIVLLDLKDQSTGFGDGATLIEQYHELCDIVVFTGELVENPIRFSEFTAIPVVAKPLLNFSGEIEKATARILNAFPNKIRAEIRSSFDSEFVDEHLGSDF